MKKILIVLMSTMFCFMIFAGCDKNNNIDNNGGTNMEEEQPEAKPITTLEGIWQSEKNIDGEYERIIVKGNSIKFYYRGGGLNETENGTLYWAGIYYPIEGPVSEGNWTFQYDDNEQVPYRYPVEFKYSDGKLSCDLINSFGRDTTIYLTKIPE